MAARALKGTLRANPGVAAIVALGLAWGLTVHSVSWAQLSYFAQVRAFADQRADIDPWHWETLDVAWIEGHFYSVKAPGVAALSLPIYLALEHTGGPELAQDAASNARGADHPHWKPDPQPATELYGYSLNRGRAVQQRVERETPLIWPLTLIIAVVPAVLLLLGVRWAADRMEPGYGTAAAITLGLGTILMTFASEYFSHAIAAALAFAAFLVLMRERDGPPRTGLVAGAGLLAGLAITFEFQVGLVGLILLAYALARKSRRTARALGYGAAALLGAAPVFLFNQWAFDDPLKFAYSSAVSFPGTSGHAVLGLNSHGFFGIGRPHVDNAIELLLAGRGLLVLTPIIVMALVGVVLMGRRHRPEAITIAAIAIVYFGYNTAYWLPMGGGTPGPRFLLPALPFVALGLAFAYKRFPAITLGLAIPSAVFMVAGALTYPLVGEEGTGRWADMLAHGDLEHTPLTVLGVSNGWVAIVPVVGALLAAALLAAYATPRLEIGPLWPTAIVLLSWAAISAVGPVIAGDFITPLQSGGHKALALIAVGCLLSLLTLALLRRREDRAQSALEPPAGPGRAVTSEAAVREPTL